LRCMIMATKTVQDRFNSQRRALGLPEVDYAALALETAQLPPELLDASVEESDSEFVVEADDEAEEAANAGADIAQTGPTMDFAERVEQAKEANV